MLQNYGCVKLFEKPPIINSPGLNQKVIGMFKDEVTGMNIVKYGGKRSKSYTYVMEAE